MHRNIFVWIELQKKPIPIALSLIILVAVFNIISTLFLIVIERTSAIGILKSLGLNKSQITNIFILQGLQITVYGILLGNILALFLMFIQLKFNIIKVPSSIYMVTEVPFDFSLSIFLIVSVITLILALISSILPSIFSARINPIKAIRFQ
jgi:lipoprotein-releasing system permease protein